MQLSQEKIAAHNSERGELGSLRVFKHLHNLVRENHLAYKGLLHRQPAVLWRRSHLSAKGHMRKPTDH